MPQPSRTAPLEVWHHAGTTRLRIHIWNDDAPGRPLVFLNGIGSPLELIPPFAAQFGDTRLIAIEMPGSGQTPETDIVCSPIFLARLVVQACAALGAERFDLMGFSLGGVLAQQVALQYRKEVAKLILAGTCSGFTMLTHDWREVGLFSSAFPFLKLWNELEHDLGKLHQATNAATFALPDVMSRQLLGFTGWSSLAFLPFLASPTLILAGTRDSIIAPSNAVQLSTFIPGSRQEWIDDGGHLFPFLKPDQTAQKIRPFLGRTSVVETMPAAVKSNALH
ncbi:alpha/beta fold hydrolase [Henriciella barbarensis]|uniref:alpha/beta fold hydrolase n=1 Tax=Henriciella barbarensis TaxID=86342 RepID=UPI0015F95244|nr:alpha/beta hydrolase [Henriciella barbarensis]